MIVFWGSRPELALCLHILYHALSSVVWGFSRREERYTAFFPLKYLFTLNVSVAIYIFFYSFHKDRTHKVNPFVKELCVQVRFF